MPNKISMKPIKCENCGASLELYSYGKFAKCPYCNTQFLLENNNSSYEYAKYKNTKVCPVCRGNESFARNIAHSKWKCMRCGYEIDSKALRKTVFWFCDKCDAFLNVQPGFDASEGKWNCVQCGYENDITKDNVFE